MGLVTVITSGKGGAGKSTVSVGLGCTLAKNGKRVLLIDGDAGLRSLDAMLGVDKELVFDISDIVNGNCEPIKAIYSCEEYTGLNNLFLLPAPALEKHTIHPDLMKQLVPILSRYYDHVIIDCPAGIGKGFISAVAAADRALVISTPDPICIRDSDKVRQLLEERGIRQQRLVINRFSFESFRKMQHYQDIDTIIDETGIRLIAVLPDDIHLQTNPAKAVVNHSHSPGTMALQRLAARLEGESVPLFPLERL